jgi:hypothetical protein
MLVQSLGEVCLNVMNCSSGVCSEEMFSAAAVEKGREAVGKTDRESEPGRPLEDPLRKPRGEEGLLGEEVGRAGDVREP